MEGGDVLRASRVGDPAGAAVLFLVVVVVVVV
jgi:hypothetical protein